MTDQPDPQCWHSTDASKIERLAGAVFRVQRCVVCNLVLWLERVDEEAMGDE